MEGRGQGVVEEDFGPFLYMDCSLLGRHHGNKPEREKYNCFILKEHKGVTYVQQSEKGIKEWR